MLRSLFSGIAGLRSHQTMLDVTGNNIANVNTTGFKAARTQFEDTLSQVLQNAGAPQRNEGGTNPAQVGLGVQVAGITNNFTNGATQQTGRSLDMVINGDGFFVVQQGGEQLYSRAGAFTPDAVGNLVTASGARVLGWMAGADGRIDTNRALTSIALPLTTTMPAKPTGRVVLEGNLPRDAALGTALTRSIEIYDAAGESHELTLVFTRAADSGPGAAGLMESTWTVEWRAGSATGSLGVTFDAQGRRTSAAAPSITVPWDVDGVAATPTAVTLALDDITSFATLDDISAATQDGWDAGVLQSFSMDPDGTLVGSFSNGFKQPVGQIAMSSFSNPAGLEKAGGSMFRASVNSGNAQIGVAGTGSRGALTGGALEMSNVDLSQEFTNLIIAQRGFQAGSRVITTSDELLQELVNLKR